MGQPTGVSRIQNLRRGLHQDGIGWNSARKRGCDASADGGLRDTCPIPARTTTWDPANLNTKTRLRCLSRWPACGYKTNPGVYNKIRLLRNQQENKVAMQLRRLQKGPS